MNTLSMHLHAMGSRYAASNGMGGTYSCLTPGCRTFGMFCQVCLRVKNNTCVRRGSGARGTPAPPPKSRSFLRLRDTGSQSYSYLPVNGPFNYSKVPVLYRHGVDRGILYRSLYKYGVVNVSRCSRLHLALAKGRLGWELLRRLLTRFCRPIGIS
jgi:hypothetical protein